MFTLCIFTKALFHYIHTNLKSLKTWALLVLFQQSNVGFVVCRTNHNATMFTVCVSNIMGRQM